MFEWIRHLVGRKLGVGDVVSVLDGPYAGKTGSITAVDGDRFTVYIDECCQPMLAKEALRRLHATHGTSPSDPHPAGTDQDYEVARTRIRQIPPTR